MKNKMRIIFAILILSVLIIICVFLIVKDPDNRLLYITNQKRSGEAYEKLINYVFNNDTNNTSLKAENKSNGERSLREIYGGAFIDSDGILVVNVIDDSPIEIKKIREVTACDDIKIQKVEFSYDELQTVLTLLNNRIENSPYYSVTLYETHNKILVYTENKNECMIYIQKLNINNKMVEIIERKNTYIDLN